ncbi:MULTISPECIES: type III secretion apparatus protein RspB [unclassified Pseudomonas]|uniref:type III secretion apparatus protein RspB n=1 Tax=unclassified Pseudomonas TaxID=196821 RepID=UPI0021098EF4|nr:MULTISPECIES: type III secretion apparatus protein RspB [unclassified Pseudomonas]
MRTEGNTSSGRNSFHPGDGSTDFSASSTDIDFFNSTLEHASPTMTATTKPGATNLLADASEQLIHSTNRLNKSLKAMSKDASLEDFKKYPKELSNSLLLSQLLVRSLGKTTQCIDKICNLQ